MLTVKGKKIFATMLAIVMVVSLMSGLGAITSAAEGGTGAISITKKELGANGQQLVNRRVAADSSKGDSVCLAGDFSASNNWFQGISINYAEMKATHDGIDYYVVGNNYNISTGASVYGTVNIRIIDVGGVEKIAVTLNNGIAGKEWGLIASNNQSSVKHPDLNHDFTGTYGTINCPTPDGSGYIYLYFHGHGFGSVRYTEPDATYFQFRVEKENASGDYEAYPINATNVIFRGEGGVVIYDGGNITPGVGTFRMKNGITATLSNLPAGKYQIIETTNDTYITSATVDPGGPVNGSTVELTISDDGYVQVVFENRLISYDLTITKEVVATPSGITITDNNTFPIMVTFFGNNLNQITSNNGSFQHNSSNTVWNGVVSAAIPATFSGLSAGTRYTIAEPGLRPSYTLSTSSSTSLALDGDGLKPLDVDDSEDPSAPYSYSANLVNIYEPVAEFTLAAGKTVIRGVHIAPASWTSLFTLYNSNAAGELESVVQENVRATAGNQIAVFNSIILHDDDEHYYILKETGVTGNGIWTVDDTTYYIKVEADTSDPPEVTFIGWRTAPIVPGEDEVWTSIATNSSIVDISNILKFTNTYRPTPTSLSLPMRKTVSNTSQNGTFNFEIIDSITSDVVATCSRTGSGNFSTVFTPITFDAVGLYTYVVMEVDPGAPWTATTSPITIYVNVTDTGSGTLTVKAYRNQNLTGEIYAATDLVFNNTYTPVPLTPTRLQLGITKTVTSTATPPSTWSFNFEIYESNSSGRQGTRIGTATATNSSPTTVFPEIEYRATGGPYYYLIRETSLGGNGWTVDNRQYLVEVTLQSQSNALRVSQVRYRIRTGSSGSFGSWSTYNSSSIVFNNTFTPGLASIDLIGIKTVNAGAASKTFGITVTNITGGANTLISRTYVWPGAFTLPSIPYTVAGDYVYRIEEDDPGTGWVRNTPPYTIYVSVTGEEGQLNAKVYTMRDGSEGAYTYDDSYLLTASDLAFDNTYTASVGGYFDLSLVKTVTKVNGEDPARFNSSGTPIVRRGDKVTFTISVRNEGSLPGFAEEISDYIPSGFDFIESDNPDWDYDPDTRIAKTTALGGDVYLLSPEAGETPAGMESIDIVLTVSGSAPSGGTLKNVAEITGFGGANHDPIDDEIEENNRDDDDVVLERDYYPDDTQEEDEDDDDDDDDDDGRIIENNDDEDEEEDDEDNNGGGGNRQPYIPGGREREVPPAPTILGNQLVALDDGGWIEFDEDGVPLGEWHWDDPLEMWIFEEYLPLDSAMPQTNTIGSAQQWLYGIFVSMLSAAIIMRYTPRVGKASKKK